jgi:hypothetical protein
MANEFKHTDPGTTLTESAFIDTTLHQFNSQVTGDIPIATSATQISRLAKGGNKTFLGVSGSGTGPAYLVLCPFFIYDDTLVTVTGTADVQEKYFRFFIDATYCPLKTFNVMISLWSNNASYTASAKFSLDAGGVGSALTLTSVATSEGEQSGVIDVSGLAAGIHTCYLYMNGGNVSGTASHQLFNVIGVP